MREWSNPRVYQLGVEKTEDNCTTRDNHWHCDKGDSSSSCDCIPMTPIEPALPGVS